MGRVVSAAAPDSDFDSDFTGSRADPVFRTIAIVGLGLMGGSLALAIRERWPETVIVGVDRPEVLADAVARGIITRGAPSAGALVDAAADASLHLVVLAAPVLQNIACLRELAAAAAVRTATDARRPLLVTDVGSTKHPIVAAARDFGRQLTFVGGHPIAGAAHAGLAHARADLFRGRLWIFTPDVDASAGASPLATMGSRAASGEASTPPSATPREAARAALSALRGFVRELGAEPAVLGAEEHDRVMAYVSHLPQLASSAVMRVVGEAVGAPGLALSGPGLADTTRLASSPASVWSDILQSNAGHVRDALDALIADLQAVRDQLASPAASAWLDAGARWRAHLRNGTRID
jgi:prephenate dehydrogenase